MTILDVDMRAARQNLVLAAFYLEESVDQSRYYFDIAGAAIERLQRRAKADAIQAAEAKPDSPTCWECDNPPEYEWQVKSDHGTHKGKRLCRGCLRQASDGNDPRWIKLPESPKVGIDSATLTIPPRASELTQLSAEQLAAVSQDSEVR